MFGWGKKKDPPKAKDTGSAKKAADAKAAARDAEQAKEAAGGGFFGIVLPEAEAAASTQASSGSAQEAAAPATAGSGDMFGGLGVGSGAAAPAVASPGSMFGSLAVSSGVGGQAESAGGDDATAPATSSFSFISAPPAAPPAGSDEAGDAGGSSGFSFLSSPAAGEAAEGRDTGTDGGAPATSTGFSFLSSAGETSGTASEAAGGTEAGGDTGFSFLGGAAAGAEASPAAADVSVGGAAPSDGGSEASTPGSGLLAELQSKSFTPTVGQKRVVKKKKRSTKRPGFAREEPLPGLDPGKSEAGVEHIGGDSVDTAPEQATPEAAFNAPPSAQPGSMLAGLTIHDDEDAPASSGADAPSPPDNSTAPKHRRWLGEGEDTEQSEGAEPAAQEGDAVPGGLLSGLSLKSDADSAGSGAAATVASGGGLLAGLSVRADSDAPPPVEDTPASSSAGAPSPTGDVSNDGGGLLAGLSMPSAGSEPVSTTASNTTLAAAAEATPVWGAPVEEAAAPTDASSGAKEPAGLDMMAGLAVGGAGTTEAPEPAAPEPAAPESAAAAPVVSDDSLEGVLERFAKAADNWREELARTADAAAVLAEEEHTLGRRVAEGAAALKAAVAEQDAAIEAEDYDAADALNDKIEGLRAAAAAVEAERSALAKRKAELAKQRSGIYAAQVETVGSTLDTLERVRARQRKAVRDQRFEGDEQIESLTRRVDREAEQLRVLEEQVLKDEDQVETETKEVEEALDAETHDLKERETELEGRHGELAAEVAALELALEAKRREAENCKSDLHEVRDKISEVRGQFDRQLSRIEQKRTAVAEERKEYDSNAAELSRITAERDAAKSEAEAAAARLEEKLQKASAEHAAASLLETMLRAEGAARAARDELGAGADSDRAALEEGVVRADAKVDAATAHRAEVEAELRDKRTLVTSADRRLPDLQESKREAVKARKFKEAKGITAQIAELTEAQAAAQADVERLSQELDEAIAEIKACESARDAAQGRLDGFIAEQGAARIEVLQQARKDVMKRSKRLKKDPDVASSQLGSVMAGLLGDEQHALERELRELGERLDVPVALEDDVSDSEEDAAAPAGDVDEAESTSVDHGDAEGEAGSDEPTGIVADEGAESDVAPADEAGNQGDDAVGEATDGADAVDDPQAPTDAEDGTEMAEEAKAEADGDDASGAAEDDDAELTAEADDGAAKEDSPTEEEIAAMRAELTRLQSRRTELDQLVEEKADADDFDGAEEAQGQVDEVAEEIAALETKAKELGISLEEE